MTLQKETSLDRTGCNCPSLLNELTKRERWEEFLDHRKDKNYLPERKLKELEEFIGSGGYEEISLEISEGSYEFSTPRKKQINRNRVGKKRDVYAYRNDEMIILKMISHLLREYDHLFTPNLYSFRSSHGVKGAIYDLLHVKNLSRMYGYKVDIRNYFNSVNIEKLLKGLDQALADDRKLYDFFERILSNPFVTFQNRIIEEQKGIMAGVPISAFLANFYLKDLDRYFFEKNVVYFRYADDIILFSNDRDEVEEHKEKISSFLEERGLLINHDKEFFYEPGERFEFLGFSCGNGIIDLSDNTIKKIKGKISRASRSVRRWARKRNASGDACIKVMIKKFDIKFFGTEDDDLSWKYWFFPTINTDAGLKIVDEYMQENLRYVVTGRHNKKNYEEVPYDRLKSCGYRSLVHEYYSGRK